MLLKIVLIDSCVVSFPCSVLLKGALGGVWDLGMRLASTVSVQVFFFFFLQVSNVAMATKLRPHLALLTGSTSGIGLGIARVIASKGYDIIINGFGSPQVDTRVQREGIAMATS